MTRNVGRRPRTNGDGDQRSRVVGTATDFTVRRAGDKSRAIDERRRASRELDRLLPDPQPRRAPATFGLTVDELRAHRSDLLTTGGVMVGPRTPWTPAEVDRVLDVEGWS